ncbi:MAG: hypothetical protein JKY70_17655 [Mucilaginibacter sp.]|nr:hypothetical protein [Mucilaginibacter sp.]
MNITTVDIVRDDTGKISVTIEPALERDGDTEKETGCYVLYNGEGFVGEICFNRDDKYDWEYVGDQLSHEEQNQIALHIQAQI